MPQHMFRDVVNPSIAIGEKRRYSVPFSIAVHVIVVLLALIVPILEPDVLPMPKDMMAFLAAAPLPAPPPPPPPSGRARPAATDINLDTAPVSAPTAITPEPAIDVDRSSPGTLVGVVEGVPDSLIENAVAPPPPPPPAAAAPVAPVRVNSGIRAPMKIKDVATKYPAVALAARVEGIVIIEATIGTTGKVEDVKVLRSIPLLDAAALDAVRQWEYAPTLLNGVPVAVIMTVTVRFTLN